MTTYRDAVKYGAFKPAYKYPKLEEIAPRSTWAFSLNPTVDYSNYFEFFKESEKEFSSIPATFDLRPELSTENFRWHWHGYITFGNAFHTSTAYILLKKLKEFGTFTIVPVESWEWFVYVRKQRPLLKPYIQTIYNPEKTPVKYHLRISIKK